MKTLKLQNAAASFTGRAMLYCYRSYIFLFKETGVYKQIETTTGKGHIRFTSNRFKTPCYN
ncbi:MAG: hypothetical protein ABIR15_14325 [Chitinophagaceae bacterium]